MQGYAMKFFWPEDAAVPRRMFLWIFGSITPGYRWRELLSRINTCAD
jgi:hypothetical protein